MSNYTDEQLLAMAMANIGEYIEYGTTVIGNGVFERTGLVAQAGIYVHVYTTAATGAMTCNVYGIETSTT